MALLWSYWSLRDGLIIAYVVSMVAALVASLIPLAREFGLMASVGSDFHAPGEWSELGLHRPLPEDLSPLWVRFDHDYSSPAC